MYCNFPHKQCGAVSPRQCRPEIRDLESRDIFSPQSGISSGIWPRISRARTTSRIPVFIFHRPIARMIRVLEGLAGG